MSYPTELHLHWSGVCPVSLNVQNIQRAMSANELRLVADIVEAVETALDEVASVECET